MKCGSKLNHFAEPMLVMKELRVNFDTSDMTWLIFVSQPTEFICTNKAIDNAAVNNLPPGVVRQIIKLLLMGMLRSENA